MCRLGWVAIHHIPWVEAEEQARRQAGKLLFPPSRLQGRVPVINSQSHARHQLGSTVSCVPRAAGLREGWEPLAVPFPT